MKQTIYNYVIEHLDAHGRFNAAQLCDDRFSTIPKPLGGEDAFYYTMGSIPNPMAASKLLKLLRAYLQEPAQQQRSKLYKALTGTVFAEYSDHFVEAFDGGEMNAMVYDLARRFFYNAEQREQVKFAILLFGIYGMEQLQNKDEELWQDLVRLAHCEEFTFAFLYACRLTNFSPQNEIWELIRCTSSWGKVFAILDCRCRSDEERLWLLEYGPEIDVEYPPLAVKFITAIKLGQLLQQPLEYKLYKSAVVILGNYLIMLNHFPIDLVEEQFNIADINLYSMLQNLLKQSERLATRPDDILDMISFARSLQQLLDEQNLSQLTLNQCSLLIAACEKIIYSKDWREDISAGILNDGQINYQLCDLAFELDMDIWQFLYDYWLEHPDEIALFPYLLSYEGEQRSERVLQQIEALLPYYSSEQDALMVPLRYLSTHPGQGEAIICAALESIYDLPRGIACGILDDWGTKFITPAIHSSLITARRLSNNDVVTARIDTLLEGKKFDIGKFIHGMSE